MDTVAQLIEQPNGVRPKNNGRAWRVVFTSHKVEAFLRSLGLTEAKSRTITWPMLPKHLEGAFVRGVLDGDGSVMLNQRRKNQQAADLNVQFVGASIPFRDALSEWLTGNTIRHSIRMNPKSLVWSINVIQQSSATFLYNLLYRPGVAVPCLRRKKDNYDRWLAQPRARTGRIAAPESVELPPLPSAVVDVDPAS